MRIRPAEPGDRTQLERFLTRWHSLRVARRGEMLAPLDHPIVVADDGGRLVGAATYVVRGEACELLTLHVDDRLRGTGTALLEHVRERAREAGCRRLWLITTNDNLGALRFYQRRGLRLAALHPGAVDDSRARMKPEIPELGDHGIRIRDELELEQDLTAG